MVFPWAKLVFRFRLSFNQILSPGLQLNPGFSKKRYSYWNLLVHLILELHFNWENLGYMKRCIDSCFLPLIHPLSLFLSPSLSHFLGSWSKGDNVLQDRGGNFRPCERMSVPSLQVPAPSPLETLPRPQPPCFRPTATPLPRPHCRPGKPAIET